MKRLYFLITALLVVLLPTLSEAYVGLCCGKCGGNMPLNIVGGGVPETHEFRIKLQPMFMRMEGLQDGTTSITRDSLLTGMPVDYMAAPSAMDMYMTNLAIGYSFTDDFFGGLMFMWNRKSMDMEFGNMMKMSTGQDGFTMESDGIGDTMLMTKYRLFTDDPLIPKSQASFFFGLSIPTGSIDEKNTKHPLAAKQEDQLPYGMQLGSGTFDPTIGILYQGSLSPWWWGANLLYTGRLYDNKRDYRLGNELRLDLYGMFQLRHDTVLELQLNSSSQGEISGEMDDVSDSLVGVSGMTGLGYTTPLWVADNYGGNKMLTTVGLQWQPAPLHIVNAQLSVPLYQDTNGEQLAEKYRVMLTWYIEIPTKKSRRYTRGNKPDKSRLGF
jgi:hypothetical protein